MKTGKKTKGTTKTLATIADDCDNVLAFLQDVAVKSLRVTVAPLSLHADKHRASGSDGGQTPTSPRHPSGSHNTTRVSQAS